MNEKYFAFNVFNYEMVDEIVKQSKILDTSVIIQTSVSFVNSIDCCLFAEYFHNIKGYYNHDKAILHLDHCQDKDLIEQCYNWGWDSALFDGSFLDLEENIKQTKLVRETASKLGKNLEGEITPIYGVEDEIIVSEKKNTAIENAIRYCAETKVDWFAPSVGTYHGIIDGEIPQVNFELLKEISDKTGVPLVLHGGSGLTNKDFCEAFNSGVTKINISTELKQSLQTVFNNIKGEKSINPIKFNQLLKDRLNSVIIPKLKLLKEV